VGEAGAVAVAVEVVVDSVGRGDNVVAVFPVASELVLSTGIESSADTAYVGAIESEISASLVDSACKGRFVATGMVDASGVSSSKVSASTDATGTIIVGRSAEPGITVSGVESPVSNDDSSCEGSRGDDDELEDTAVGGTVLDPENEPLCLVSTSLMSEVLDQRLDLTNPIDLRQAER
jgi:hypothetical protein